MKRLDYLTAAIMALLAAVVVVATRGLDFWDDFGPSTRFMPIWVAGVTIILTGLLVVEAARRKPDTAVDWPDRLGATRVVFILLAIIVFIALVPWLGFVPATLVFVLAVLLGIERRPLVASLATAVITAGLIHVIFAWWLTISFPKGVLGI